MPARRVWRGHRVQPGSAAVRCPGTSARDGRILGGAFISGQEYRFNSLFSITSEVPDLGRRRRSTQPFSPAALPFSERPGRATGPLPMDEVGSAARAPRSGNFFQTAPLRSTVPAAFRRFQGRSGTVGVVNAIGAIVLARLIENARLKGAVGCGTFCMPEGSGIRRKGCRRWRDRPLLEAISCFRAARDFNLPGCDQTAVTPGQPSSPADGSPPTGLFHWAGARPRNGAAAIAARIAVLPLAGAPQTEDTQ